MSTIMHVARKEFSAFFATPAAFIFLGSFLAVTLFIFFWVEQFFAANIAEIRPLFGWMPILLIFLIGAVTMRSFSEERRAGTLEYLLTAPVAPLQLVLGKFFACLALVAVSLILTLPILVTVALLGPLDWGPVYGGYLAALFLASAYIAIGLFVSTQSENQIVSLITTVVIGALFYLLGTETLGNLMGYRGAEILHLLGTGSRFQSITRGVIDLRDLYYYICIAGVFITLTIFSLERLRWANNPSNRQHRRWKLATVLLIANLLAANFWLAPLGGLRADLTSGSIYSISDTTRRYLAQLREPLLIRGYFSPQTHPLLAPLIPRLRDLLAEYGEAGGAKVRVEFIDPLANPELEQEAGQRFGIRPNPFQTADRYQAAVTNSYFDILILYGDQFETLGFRDLIEVKIRPGQELDVELRNPEYDITRTIKKVLYGYQSGGDLFAAIDTPLSFTGYISPDHRLPNELITLRADLDDILVEFTRQSDGAFTAAIIDPDADGGLVAKQIEADFGFRPMALSLFDDNQFWFYLTLAGNGEIVQVPVPEDLSRESLQRSLEAALKRFSSGFTRSVGLYTPPPPQPPIPQLGVTGGGRQFQYLKELLGQQHRIIEADLAGGRVPAEADILLVAAPESLTEKQVFGIDQFLMQGGTVIIATAPFAISLQGPLALARHQSGLSRWLAHHGITIAETLVLDPQSSPFPVPVQRSVGGFTVQETHLVNYPFFVDIRPDGMDRHSTIFSTINQLTMNWASPIEIDPAERQEQTLTPLLHSSALSWTTTDTSVQPDFERYGELGFDVGDDRERRVLGILAEGNFTSFFAGSPSPLLSESSGQPAADEPAQEQTKPVIARQLDKSAGTARLFVFSSNEFIEDTILGIGASVRQTEYLNPVQMLANVVDWSLEDRDLLEIRGHVHFSRPLAPLSGAEQRFWEYLNYGLAVAGLAAVWLLKIVLVNRSRRHWRRMTATH